MTAAPPSRASLSSRLLPPAVAWVVLLAHTGLMYNAALKKTAGAISYPVDDAFIHLALAKQLVTTGTYGITPHEFAAASSSIGWPLLLAGAFAIFGVKVWLPLALNVAFSGILLWVVDRAVVRWAAEAGLVARTLVGLLVVVFTPLPTLVVLGMEHTAHAAANIALLTAATTWLAADTEDRRGALGVAICAALTTLCRFEGMFPVAMIVALAVVRKRTRGAAIVAAAGAFPVVAFGIYSKAHGAFFLPTPVVLKGRHFDIDSLGEMFGKDLVNRFNYETYVPVIACACAIAFFAMARRDGFWSRSALAPGIALFVLLTHVLLAGVGWFFRYESYFIATGLVVVGSALAREMPPRRELARWIRERPTAALAGLLAVATGMMPLVWRAKEADASTPTACRNIYDQQVQMGTFLGRYFPHDKVAVNDIGAVAWFGDEPVVDLVGLASLPVARAKGLRLDADMRGDDLARLTQGVEVAIVYDEWFPKNLPASWLRVGRWTIDGRKSPAFADVAIYAAVPEHYPVVVNALRAYAKDLPKSVRTHGRFADYPLDDKHLRAGDQVVVRTSDARSTGSYELKSDGCILLKLQDGQTLQCIRGKTEAEAADLVRAEVPSLKIESITRVARRGADVLVGGAVLTSGEAPSTAKTIDDVIVAAGTLPTSHPEAAFVWREAPSAPEGFVKVPRSALGELVDGDIVVVP